MKLRLFFRELRSKSGEHPVDRFIEERLEEQVAQRNLASLSSAIVSALGEESQLWFSYEKEKLDFERAREEAYFDAGVEHGLTAAAANELTRQREQVSQLAQRLIAEALAVGLGRQDSAIAAVMAAWSLLSRSQLTRQRGK